MLAVVYLCSDPIRQVLAHLGHPAVPLDDAFIHFQFARTIADGKPFEYTAGQGPVAGATSLLWPLVFVPFYGLGVDGLSIIWIAWILGCCAFAALIVEIYRLCAGLMDRPIALGCAALSAVFGGHVWFAVSGMETIPFAWILARTAS